MDLFYEANGKMLAASFSAVANAFKGHYQLVGT